MLKKVAKNTFIVSISTFFSMSMGLVRDILLASFFGTSAILEAFIVAFRLPNLFRSILGEGFADSVATPVLSEYQEDREKIFSIGSNLLSFSMLVLSLMTVLGVIFAKPLVMVIAPGFLDDPAKFSMTVDFTRITFFYLFFIGVSVNSFSILYTLKKFFIPSITPIFLNLSFIVGIIFFNQYFENYILVICVLVGGILQVVFPLIFLRKEGFKFKFNIKDIFKDKVLLRMLKLFPPRILSGAVYQLSVIVDTVFASFAHIVGQGAVASLLFANRYVHLPIAVFIHAICKVAMVDLSFYHSKDNLDDFKKLLVFSFSNLIFFVVPISVTYMFLSTPIIDVILHRGDFSIQSLNMTASILFFYSFGLFFFCSIKLLVNVFYALKDTLTPAKVTGISLVINVILSALFMYPLKIGGVALGSSIAAIFNFFILYYLLIKKIGKLNLKDVGVQLVKVLIISLAISSLARFFWYSCEFNRYIKAIIMLFGYLIIYTSAGLVFKLPQVNFARKWILKKR